MKARPTGLVYGDRCLAHDPGPGIPETAARLRAVVRALGQAGLMERLLRIEPSPAPPGCVRRIHDDLHVARVREASRRAPVVLDGDTVAGRLVSVLEGGYDIDAVGESAAEHVRALIS